MMTNKGKEKISAFLDGDMHQDELMSFSLSSEPEDAKLVQRYQIIGDVMRGELSESSFVDVSHAVREALADETLIVEDNIGSVQPEAVSPSEEVVSGGWNLAAWFKPATGIAVAASVAVVMVTTLSSQESGGPSPVASNTELQPVVTTADVKSTNKNAKELTPYVNQHLEYATQDTLQGRLPFIRAVGYEAEK